MLASVPWVVVLLGVGLLVTLLLVALLSFRGSERSALPPPPPPAPPMLFPTLSPAASPTASATVTATPAATPTRTTSSPSARPTSSASVAVAPPAAGGGPATGGGRVTARYDVTDSDRDSFEAELLVRNGTDRAQDWEVELLFTGNVKSIRVSSGSGISVRTNGSGWYVLRGTVGAEASEPLSLRFTRNGTGDVPGQCTVNGADCLIG